MSEFFFDDESVDPGNGKGAQLEAKEQSQIDLSFMSSYLLLAYLRTAREHIGRLIKKLEDIMAGVGSR